jgi:hypothetical protein
VRQFVGCVRQNDTISPNEVIETIDKMKKPLKVDADFPGHVFTRRYALKYIKV